MTLVLVQMHGHPGSGKSTLARSLGNSLAAIVIDKDVIASALIRHGVPFAEAGAPAYQVMYALAERFLADGHSVIFDSPCFWPLIEETTRRVASEAGAVWCMVETQCPDEVRDARLSTRARLESNPGERDRGPMRPGMYHPSCERFVVDTARPLDATVSATLSWIREQAGLPLPSPSGEGLGERLEVRA